MLVLYGAAKIPILTFRDKETEIKRQLKDMFFNALLLLQSRLNKIYQNQHV